MTVLFLRRARLLAVSLVAAASTAVVATPVQAAPVVTTIPVQNAATDVALSAGALTLALSALLRRGDASRLPAASSPLHPTPRKRGTP